MEYHINKTPFTLAEGDTHVALLDNYRKNAFTLAEVLITLGIIGVVAALTLGALIPNFEKQRNLSVLKKAYSEMQNYVLDFKQYTGCIDIKVCWPNSDEFYTPFAEYLIAKRGFTEYVPFDRSWGSMLLFSAFRGNQMVGLNGGYYRNTEHPDNYIPLVSPSGTYMAVIYSDYYSYGNSAAIIYFLVNNKRFGIKSARFANEVQIYPGDFSRAGKDLFIAHVSYDGKFVPEGVEPYRYWKDNDNCNPDNSETMNVSGYGCLGRIIEDGWQIKYKW